MEDFNKCFDERTVDGVCAVVFWPARVEISSEIMEKYIFIYLYDTPFSKNKCWFCIRRDSVPAKGKVTLEVPAAMAGKVIGYKGTNAKTIAKELGGRYVTIQKV